MASNTPIADLLEDLYSTIRQPYRWKQVWPMLPLLLLRLISALGYVLSVLGLLPASIYGGLDFCLNCCVAVFLFLLAKAYYRYRTAAIFMSASIAISILSVLLGKPLLWDVIAALLVLVANFFEYSSHAIIAARQSGSLADRWDHLFLWAFGTIFFGAFAFILTLVLSYMFESIGLLSVIISYAPDLLVDILYLIYMACTIRLVLKAEKTRKKGENYGS